jgi:hypothetical protein
MEWERMIENDRADWFRCADSKQGASTVEIGREFAVAGSILALVRSFPSARDFDTLSFDVRKRRRFYEAGDAAGSRVH